MDTKVYKLGGTILKKELETPCFSLRLERLIRDYNIIIIVSAIGRENDPYSTDGLESSISGEMTPKERDRLLGIGETYAVIKYGASLRTLGYKVQTYGVEESLLVSDSNYNEARLKRYVPLSFDGSDISLVPGFIARDENYHLTTMGRESSDLSAVYYAIYYHLRKVVYIKDITSLKLVKDGMFTKESYRHINYKDALRLARTKHFPIAYEALKESSKYDLDLEIRNDRHELLGRVKSSYPPITTLNTD